jgi:hypothetical protein
MPHCSANVVLHAKTAWQLVVVRGQSPCHQWHGTRHGREVTSAAQYSPGLYAERLGSHRPMTLGCVHCESAVSTNEQYSCGGGLDLLGSTAGSSSCGMVAAGVVVWWAYVCCEADWAHGILLLLVNPCSCL